MRVVLGYALKFTWKAAKTIGLFGWIVVPFPVDIFTGLISMMCALILAPFVLLAVPLIPVVSNYVQIKKDYDAAEEYLRYCRPTNVSAGAIQESDME